MDRKNDKNEKKNTLYAVGDEELSSVCGGGVVTSAFYAGRMTALGDMVGGVYRDFFYGAAEGLLS